MEGGARALGQARRGLSWPRTGGGAGPTPAPPGPHLPTHRTRGLPFSLQATDAPVWACERGGSLTGSAKGSVWNRRPAGSRERRAGADGEKGRAGEGGAARGWWEGRRHRPGAGGQEARPSASPPSWEVCKGQRLSTAQPARGPLPLCRRGSTGGAPLTASGRRRRWGRVLGRATWPISPEILLTPRGASRWPQLRATWAAWVPESSGSFSSPRVHRGNTWGGPRVRIC